MSKPTIHSLRIKSFISLRQLAQTASIDYATARRADRNQLITENSRIKIVKALNKLLGSEFTLDDVAWCGDSEVKSENHA